MESWRSLARWERRTIAGLYIFLLAGGLWNLAGVFQDLLRAMAGPFLILLSLGLLWAAARSRPTMERYPFTAWAALVVAGGLMAEWIGLTTGAVFGHYEYGAPLKPQIDGVPLAIGFAWFSSLLASLALAQRVLPLRLRLQPLPLLLVTTGLMVLFDMVMEPAAAALGYWVWYDGAVPFLNYISWGALSLVFAGTGILLRLHKRRLPALIAHAWFAQVLYFSLSALGPWLRPLP